VLLFNELRTKVPSHHIHTF